MARRNAGGRKWLWHSMSLPAPQIFQFLGMAAVIASQSIRDLLRRVERAAQTNAAVLLTGESGSGKELVARALHHYSRRAARPWVDVSCAALPEHLMESELFGYEKGAFSGADSAKPGLIEMADTGTLFLDEIAELEARMQVKLLRVLDGIPYYRLGGVKKVTVDLRLVAATNRKLEEAIRSGRFRRDLYHRLCQIHLEVPPLRERAADIAPLSEYFLRQQNPELRFTPEALDLLERYAWPGNVRELRNVVIRAAVFAPEGVIGAQDLPPEIAGTAGTRAGRLDRIERETILQVLAQTDGRRQHAADLLGISRRTLSRKLKAYRLSAVGGGEEAAG